MIAAVMKVSLRACQANGSRTASENAEAPGRTASTVSAAIGRMTMIPR